MKASFTLTALLLTISSAPSLVLGQGGFAQSCNSITLSPNQYTLSANCGKGGDGYRTSLENLDLCIVNNGNQLFAQNDGGFAASASGCYLDGTWYRCICGGTTRCEVDLNTFVTNESGYLWCFDHRGT